MKLDNIINSKRNDNVKDNVKDNTNDNVNDNVNDNKNALLNSQIYKDFLQHKYDRLQLLLTKGILRLKIIKEQNKNVFKNNSSEICNFKNNSSEICNFKNNSSEICNFKNNNKKNKSVEFKKDKAKNITDKNITDFKISTLKEITNTKQFLIPKYSFKTEFSCKYESLNKYDSFNNAFQFDKNNTFLTPIPMKNKRKIDFSMIEAFLNYFEDIKIKECNANDNVNVNNSNIYTEIITSNDFSSDNRFLYYLKKIGIIVSKQMMQKYILDLSRALRSRCIKNAAEDIGKKFYMIENDENAINNTNNAINNININDNDINNTDDNISNNSNYFIIKSENQFGLKTQTKLKILNSINFISPKEFNKVEYSYAVYKFNNDLIKIQKYLEFDFSKVILIYYLYYHNIFKVIERIVDNGLEDNVKENVLEDDVNVKDNNSILNTYNNSISNTYNNSILSISNNSILNNFSLAHCLAKTVAEREWSAEDIEIFKKAYLKFNRKFDNYPAFLERKSERDLKIFYLYYNSLYIENINKKWNYKEKVVFYSLVEYLHKDWMGYIKNSIIYKDGIYEVVLMDILLNCEDNMLYNVLEDNVNHSNNHLNNHLNNVNHSNNHLTNNNVSLIDNSKNNISDSIFKIHKSVDEVKRFYNNYYKRLSKNSRRREELLYKREISNLINEK